MMKKGIKDKVLGIFPAYIDYFGNATFKQKINIAHYNISVKEETSPFPLVSKIEINGSCNLDCIMCLRKSLPNRDKLMSKNQFISVFNNIPSLIEWSPHGYNEPLLHPEFFDFVKETNDRNILLSLVTNATVLNKHNSDRLIKLEPKLIRISIDAVGQDYEKIRVGASYEKVLKNIIYLAKNYQNVSLYATIWKDNIHQIKALKELSECLGLDITFSDITWKNEFGKSNKNNSIRENDFPIDIENINISADYLKKRKCTLPWNNIYVDVIGNCYPCTDTLKYLMGNVFTTHIKNIYNSEGFQTFRKNSLSGKNYECQNCIAWSRNYQ